MTVLDFTRLVFNEQSPIYLQLVRYVQSAIVAGSVSPGEELPSRRLLSSLLGVNPNTIQKAYRMMEEEGLIVSRAGSGSVLTFTEESAARLRRQLLLENHRGILAYGAAAIDVNTGAGVVRIRGGGLELLAMTAEALRIGGRIDGVAFLG